MAGTVIPVHPEAVAGSVDELRWVMPPGTLPFVGEVASAPADLQAIVDAGVIDTLVVEPTAVRIRLCSGRSWRSDGPAIRSALQLGLATPDTWHAVVAGTADDVLRAAVSEVLTGEVGDYIRSHGGVIDVVDVTDGRVEVSLAGACAHCPASDVTLTTRFEDAVRHRFPGLTEVVATSEPGIAAGRRLLGLFPTRSH